VSNDFKICSFCGHTSSDICEFRMWQRTDSQDKPIDAYIIVCQQAACRKRIDDDPMLFIEVSWGGGGPGKFMLLCGNCPHRQEYACKHPNLKSNGGPGLEVKFSGFPIFNVMICGSGGCRTLDRPATYCAGNPAGND